MSHQRADFSHTVVFPPELEHLWDQYRHQHPAATFNGLTRMLWQWFLQHEKAATEEVL